MHMTAPSHLFLSDAVRLSPSHSMQSATRPMVSIKASGMYVRTLNLLVTHSTRASFLLISLQLANRIRTVC